MKTLRLSILCLSIAHGAFGADRVFKPAVVDAEPVEAIYPTASQCQEPKVFHAPALVYPWELGSGITGAVDVCVKIDGSGYPSRVAVLRSTQHVFERYAIANVIQTTWFAEPGDRRIVAGWFVRRIDFVQKDPPNQMPEPTSGSVTPRADARVAPPPPVAHR